MQKQPSTQIDYARAIAQLVAAMSIERAAEVYDFARFLFGTPASVPTPVVESDDDWLNDSPAQIAVEDAIWEETLTRNRAKTLALADEASAEFEAGETMPLFNEQGELNLP